MQTLHYLRKKNYPWKHKNSLSKVTHNRPPIFFSALRAFWDFEKTLLHEICVSGTVLWSPINANSPTCMYISQKVGDPLYWQKTDQISDIFHKNLTPHDFSIMILSSRKTARSKFFWKRGGNVTICKRDSYRHFSS